jgi:hypothetical protein
MKKHKIGMPPALVLIPGVPPGNEPSRVAKYIAEFSRINSLKPCWFKINGRRVLL